MTWIPDPMPLPDPVVAAPRPAARAGRLLLAGAAVLGLVFAVNEWLGWPWLARPAEQWLSERLAHPVSLTQGQAGDVRLRVLGTVRLTVNELVVGPPAWAGSAPLLYARDLDIRVGWPALLAWRPGQALALDWLSASQVSVDLVRDAGGRANWTLAPTSAEDGADTPLSGGPVAWPVRVARFHLGEADLSWSDRHLGVDLQARARTRDVPVDPGAPSGGEAAPNALDRLGLEVALTGRYRGQPLGGEVRTGAMSDWWLKPQGLPLRLEVHAGGAGLRYDGQFRPSPAGVLVSGDYEVRGASLAQAGRPLGLTLPATGAFRVAGRLSRQGDTWATRVERAEIGRSRLSGAFQFRAVPGQVPELTGQLQGAVLRLADLGPAFGADASGAGPRPAADRVLPQRQFDLPALRAMDADVQIGISRLDFDAEALQAAAPVRGRLQLRQGVLTLDDLDIGLAQGRLTGVLRLDGNAEGARWQAALSLRQARLEQWVRALHRDGASPLASGLITAHLALAGAGRSTAEWLGSAGGQLSLRWTEGRVSHLAVEALGLDLAQSLGVWLKGDRALAVRCGLLDLQVRGGVVTPRVALVDTQDSRLTLAGQVSLVDERLDLTLHTAPKDLSPLAVRSPWRVTGTLGQPRLAVEQGPLLARSGAAVALGLLHPAAALLAFVDLGEAPQSAPCSAATPASVR